MLFSEVKVPFLLLGELLSLLVDIFLVSFWVGREFDAISLEERVLLVLKLKSVTFRSVCNRKKYTPSSAWVFEHTFKRKTFEDHSWRK